MKCKSMLAALAVLMTSGAAFADTPFMDALMNTMWANFAGSHNRCPRFRVIEEAINAERAEAGVTPDMLRDMTDKPLLDQYKEDPSEFCDKVWRRLGPNGTYKRQMLEAK